ncbi:MAG: BMP family ABC transporter substrate-binding protein [Acidobacteria bacterium 13_1_20CM_3_53_8]|nr:MAG: BMP family ABC transporter substrate-binding protein [Acidobacteria bacterium 13_1_20CM_3_53_8]
MKLSLALLLVCALAIALASTGCRTPTSYATADDPHKIHVGIVFDIGGKDDRSFNAAAWTGVKCAETGLLPNGQSCGKPKLDIVLRDVEPGNPTSIEPAMRAFAERHYDLIIGVGFAQAPIMESVARDYPNINFAIVDGVSQLPNVASLVFREHEGSYLVGMIAAKTSKSGTIGFIGGMDIPLIHRFEKGYEEGARAVNPNIRIIQNYVGVTDSAWNNPGKGKELALSQIGKGADVIFTAAGNSGLGAFDAVEQAGTQNGRATHFVIGVDSNQNGVKPGFVLTSMVKRVDNAVYDIVQQVVNHQFKGGFHVFGLSEEGVGYAMDDNNRSLISPDVILETEAAKQKIINGQIKVTDAMAQ